MTRYNFIHDCRYIVQILFANKRPIKMGKLMLKLATVKKKQRSTYDRKTATAIVEMGPRTAVALVSDSCHGVRKAAPTAPQLLLCLCAYSVSSKVFEKLTHINEKEAMCYTYIYLYTRML